MIYLDYNATTIIHPTVKEYMLQFMDYPANPSSVHSFGRKARKIIEAARMQIALMLGIGNYLKDYNITFTSGGTEANNLILSNFLDGDIFISALEHSSIYNYIQEYKNIKIIKVDRNGLIDLDDLKLQLADSTAEKKLVSVMFANNETGVIQEIKQIADIVHEYGGLIHSDIVQCPGKIPIDLYNLDVDFASISGHKFGGPVGIGALVSKEIHHLKPILIGGMQEKGLRSGTENVVAIAGLGVAAKLVTDELPLRYKKMVKLRDRIEAALLGYYPKIEIASYGVHRLPNTSLIINPGKKAENQLIIFDLHGVALSSGAACSSGKVGTSNTLKYMGYSKEERQSALRISVGENNNEKEIDFFIDTYKKINQSNGHQQHNVEVA
ncbi:MAG: cysteine desulfurase [Rickettsiaceae bacterium]|nr:cysteine desulfurase [Rickettsiaceae bacterium]